MKRILDIGHNDLRLFLKSKAAYIWLFAVPLAFIYFMGFANRGPGDPSNRRPPVLVENNDTNFLGRVFLDDLDTQGMWLLSPTNRESAARSIRIPEDFSRRVLAGEQSKVGFYKRDGSAESDAMLIEARLVRALIAMNSHLLEAATRLGRIIAKLSGEGPMDKFGIFISAGDLNNDGTKDLIVGAPFNTNDPAVYQGGAVYVYLSPDFTNKIALHASSANKGLGWSAAAGDITGDSIADLSISASGKVLCYYGSENFNPSIGQSDVMVKSSSAGFGKYIAITGDLNSDGFGEIIIGAPNAVVNGNRDTGSVYIVEGGTRHHLQHLRRL